MGAMMDGPMMGLMMAGGGLLLLLAIAVLVLSILALMKYLRGPR